MSGLYLEVKPNKYTKKQLEKLWKEKHLQPCTYCNALTPYTTCPRCGRIEDELLGKI